MMKLYHQILENLLKLISQLRFQEIVMVALLLEGN